MGLRRNPTPLGSEIRRRLQERNLTQSEFCEKYGIKESTLSHVILNEHRVSNKTKLLLQTLLAFDDEDINRYCNPFESKGMGSIKDDQQKAAAKSNNTSEHEQHVILSRGEYFIKVPISDDPRLEHTVRAIMKCLEASDPQPHPNGERVPD